MDLRKLRTDERAVSPVVGVALLIAITVILAAVIGGVVLGLGTSSAEAPQASLQFEYNDSGNMTVSHEGGEMLKNDTIVVKGPEGDYSLGGDLAAGESTSINTSDLSSGEEVSVVWQAPNSDDESVIGTFQYNG